MNCEKCGQETFLPFQCPHCGGQFCAAHRLPENHDCPKMELARASKQEAVLKVPSSYEYTVSFGQPKRMKGRVYFSPKELTHLAAATLIVIGVAVSIVFIGGVPIADYAVGLVAFTLIFTTAFFVHEIAHKVTAQRRGLWAEFRLTLWGSALTLVFMILPTPFKLISPGAVMISGPAQLREIGKISIAGPATNMIMSSALLSASPFVPGDFFFIFVLGALLNGYFAVFNLIPLGILDGFKIFSWNKVVWGVAFAMSLALTISAYVLYMGLLA
jgi:Zn-dependent protease